MCWYINVECVGNVRQRVEVYREQKKVDLRQDNTIPRCDTTEI